MAFSAATNFRIDQSTFNDAQGDITYHIQNHHVHGEQDIRSCVHSAMKDHIHRDAFHDSGARRDPSRCYPGTREAALKTISDWVRDSAPHCLWLHGPAGTGKTAIAQTFAEKCDQDGTFQLGATYFFTKGSTSGPGPPPLFSTLAYQLMSVFPGLDEHLWAVIRADRMIFERSLSVQLDRLIIQPFRKLDDTSTATVVIIDGLDECDGASIQGEIMRLILSLEQYSLPLLFLVGSRPEREIRRAVQSSPHSSLARLLLDKTLHPDQDIRYFLRREFERIYVEMGMPPVLEPPWPSMGVIEKLVRKSSGHFIYAATVIRFVQEGYAHPMDQLDAILNIPSEFTSSSAARIADSLAFQELDSLYLHILRKDRNRVELPKILRAIMHFGRDALPSNIEIIFNLRPGSVRIMLEGFHSIIDVPVDDEPLRFLHASFNDFLNDPERSTHEFHVETSHFNAELAGAYMRLIVAFSPAKSGSTLTMAMGHLRDSLEATRALFSATLGKLLNILTQEFKSTPPCLFYAILDFLLRKVLKEFPEAGAERKRCDIILQQLESQLIELSDNIFTIVRILGAHSVSHPKEVGRLLEVSNGGEIFQQTLNLSHYDLSVKQELTQPFKQIHESLYRWLLARHQPKSVNMGLTCVAAHRYSWAWAWDTHTSQHSHDSQVTNVDFLHDVDLNYSCLRTLILEPNQPSRLISHRTQETLKHASKLLARRTNWHHVCHCRPHIDLVRIIEAIDFASILQALPDLSTICCPKLYYLHHGLDPLCYRLQPDGHVAEPPLNGLHRPIPHYQMFLETIYSRLLQDPVASWTVPLIYAMFAEMCPQSIESLLGLVPGELYRSAGIQNLFGVGVWVERDRIFGISKSLGVLLKLGRVKLRFSPDDNSDHIDYHMGDAHEYLAIVCAKYLVSCIGPEENLDEDSDGLRSYAKLYWGDHLTHATRSERLFEMLRQVDINGRDIARVIRWLEESPDTPEDILARWHAARLCHGTTNDLRPGPRPCLLDQAFENRRSLRASRVDRACNHPAATGRRASRR